MTNIFLKIMPATAANIPQKALKGRPDVMRGCNLCTNKPQANRGCNPCTNTQRASYRCNPCKTKTLLLLLLLGLMIAPKAFAQTTFGGGSGTQTDPYIISTTNHMHQLATDVNNGTTYYNVYFKLTADLDFQGMLYTPIGCMKGENNYPFAGTFDGNNHTIRNISIGTVNPTGSHLGVFGVALVFARIENLTLASSSINGWSGVGGIVGVLIGGTSHTDFGIRNCKVAADVTLSANYAIGGIVGFSFGDVYHCVNLASVSGVNRVGAIAGYIDQMDYITDCYVGGNCTKGAVGQDGSNNGTDEGVDVTHLSNVTFQDGFSTHYFYATNPDFIIEFTRYFRCGREIKVYLEVEREVPEGYYGEEFLVGDMVLEPVLNVPHVFKFTLPEAHNAHVTIGEIKRNIAYTNWVEISIPPAQIYTGEALTPVVTITDSKDDTPVTLTEGIDYWLRLPSGGCIYPGEYTIYVFGIGNFGNVATTVFQINNPSFSFEGNGSEQTPYLIQNTDDMDALAQLVNQGFHCQGLHFRLTDNLDYTGKTYTPVGTSDNPFRGTFDGYGNTISHISIDSHTFDFLGVFGCIENGTVKYLRLANSTLKGRHEVGGIVGQGKGTIESCYIAEDVTIRGYTNAGGIAGMFQDGNITYCENHADVWATLNNAGGIVGCVQNASVVECFNFGDINHSLGSYYGGIVGKFETYAGSVNNCVNEGNVTCNSYGGGIVGALPMFCSVSLKDNLNLGAVSGNSNCGGIIGYRGFGFISNNYYAGACTLDYAIGNQAMDDFGSAMRGWIISCDEEEIFAQQWPIDEEEGTFVGITYDGIFYVGAGETTKLLIEKMDGAPEGVIAASAGVLKPLDEEFYDEINDVFYLLTMPAEGGNVTLTIEEGVTLTVAGYGESTNAGWKLIASPVVCDVAAGTVSNIFGATQYDLYRFDPSSQGSEWRNHKAASFEMQNGKGYLYAIKEEQTLVFRGTYNTAATQDVPLVYDSTDSRKCWNLVGNPFPCEAYLDRAYYVLSENGTDINPDAIQGNVPIPPCTAVFVKAVEEGDSVVFTRVAP